jgi:response regulator RpfG family c-di-GMP phosphodiesterase
MTSSRAFRNAKTAEEALDELKAQSGKQFDPAVVEAFLAVAKRLGDNLVPAAPRAREAPEAADQLIT